MVIAVIPARNEAEMLPLTLPSVLAQDELTGIVLVDDESEDGTTGIARRTAVGAGRPERMRVVRTGPKPSEWTGKAWALARGVEAVAEESSSDDDSWLLFTDADIEHRPGSVRALMEQAESGYDLVSVMARLRVGSFWERLLVPTFVYFFQLLYPFRKVVAAGSRVAAAAGGCVLVRRSVLERAGGIASISGAVIDDVALARSVTVAGGRLWLGLDAGIRSLRPYPRLMDLWRMVSRSAYDQLGYRVGLLILVLIGLVLFFVAPPVFLLAGIERLSSGAPGTWWVVAGAGIAIVLEARGLWPSVRHHGLSAPYALVLPFSSLLFAGMTLSSAWAHHSGAGVRWRGRKVGGTPVRG